MLFVDGKKGRGAWWLSSAMCAAWAASGPALIKPHQCLPCCQPAQVGVCNALSGLCTCPAGKPCMGSMERDAQPCDAMRWYHACYNSLLTVSWSTPAACWPQARVCHVACRMPCPSLTMHNRGPQGFDNQRLFSCLAGAMPAGWTDFNCLHPMKRYCTHKFRTWGLDVPRVPPNFTESLMEPAPFTFQNTVSRCAGEREAGI